MADFEMGHVGLAVRDLARSRAFYQELLGFEVKAESEQAGRRFVLLGEGGRILLTLWEQATEGFDGARSGLHHLSFQVKDLARVRAAEKALKAKGISFAHEGVVPHAEGAASGGIFFHDPDGIRLEIFAPSGLEAHAAVKTDGPACGFF